MISRHEGRWMLQCDINTTQPESKNVARSFVYNHHISFAFIGYSEIEVVPRYVCSIKCTSLKTRFIKKNNIAAQTLTNSQSLPRDDMQREWFNYWNPTPPPSKGCKKQPNKHPSKRFHQFMLIYTLHPPLPEGSQLPGSPTTLATLQPFMPTRNPLVEAPDTCAASTKALTTAFDVSSNGTFLARKGWKVRFFHPKTVSCFLFFWGGLRYTRRRHQRQLCFPKIIDST